MVKTLILLGFGSFGFDSGSDAETFCFPFCSADDWDFWEGAEWNLERGGEELEELEELDE